MPDFKIRPYQKGDEVEINNTFNEVFGQNRTIEEWYWKFQPEDNSSRIMIAVDNNGNVLSQWAAKVTMMKIDGKIFKCGEAVDSFSIKSREVLKNRVFIKVYENCMDLYGNKKDINYFYGVNSGRITKLGTTRLQYIDPIEISYLYKETKKYQRALGKVIRERMLKRYKSEIPFELNEIDDLWNRSSHRHSISVIKDGNYIKKRYITHPDKKYMYLTVKSNNKIAAIAILKFGIGKLQWVDLIWDGQDTDILKKLERQVWLLVIKLGATAVEMWLNNDNEVKDILLSQGMKTISNPYGLVLTSRSFNTELDPVDITNRLHLMMGDTDMF